MGRRRKLLIVDTNNIIARFSRSYADTQRPDGFPIGGLYGSVWCLRQFLADQPHTGVVLAMDWGVPKFRGMLCPEYKAQRAANRKPEEERIHQRYKTQMPHVYRIFNPLGIPVVRAKNWEGDDVIAALALEWFPDWNISIYSSDRDYTHLVDDRVKLFHPDKKEWVHPNNGYLMARCMDPKASDNLDGVFGIGEKKAALLVAAFQGDFPTSDLCTVLGMEAFLTWCKTVQTKDPHTSMGKMCAKVTEAKQKVRANFKVTNLRDVAVECAGQLKWRRGTYDRKAFKAVCAEYMLNPLLRDLSAITPVFENLESPV